MTDEMIDAVVSVIHDMYGPDSMTKEDAKDFIKKLHDHGFELQSSTPPQLDVSSV